MPTPQPAIRVQTNRVKKHILDRFLKLADKIDANEKLSSGDESLYKELLLTFAKNVVPRTQEVTGEDGQPLIIQIAKEVADKNVIDDSPSSDSEGQPQI